MIDYSKIHASSFEFSEEERKALSELEPLIVEHAEEIVEKVLASAAKNKEVLNVLEKNGVSAEDAKNAWIKGLKFIFSANDPKDITNEMVKIGVIHVEKDVKEDLVIQAITLFIEKTHLVLNKYTEIDTLKLRTLTKTFNFVLLLMISAYRNELEEREKAVLTFMGISPELLKRQIALGKKDLKK